MKYLFFILSMGLIWACQPKELTTPSGYKYIHHVQTNGQKPQVGEEISFEVDVRNDTGVVQSSRQQGEPARFLVPQTDQVGKSISPIVEALMLMSIGDSLTIMQSTDSFPRKPPGFENAAFIYYDLVLKEIKSKEIIAAERAAEMAKMDAAKARESDVRAQTKDVLDKYLANQLGDQLFTTESGLKYYVIEAGTGKQAESGRLVDVHYYGMLTNGKEFDNSFKRGQPYPVPVGRGQVIRGWDEGLALFKEGTKAILFVPGDLGYGATGSPPNIGPNAELVFYVELDKVR